MRSPARLAAPSAFVMLAAALVIACSSASSSSPDGGAANVDSGAANDASTHPASDASGGGSGGGDGSTTNDGAAPSDGSGGTCSLHGSTGKGACDACVVAACCDVANTCFDDTSGCAALLTCAQECKSSDGGVGPDGGTFTSVGDCENACANTFPGTSAASDLLNCESGSCASDCL